MLVREGQLCLLALCGVLPAITRSRIHLDGLGRQPQRILNESVRVKTVEFNAARPLAVEFQRVRREHTVAFTMENRIRATTIVRFQVTTRIIFLSGLTQSCFAALLLIFSVSVLDPVKAQSFEYRQNAESYIVGIMKFYANTRWHNGPTRARRGRINGDRLEVVTDTYLTLGQWQGGAIAGTMTALKRQTDCTPGLRPCSGVGNIYSSDASVNITSIISNDPNNPGYYVPNVIIRYVWTDGQQYEQTLKLFSDLSTIWFGNLFMYRYSDCPPESVTTLPGCTPTCSVTNGIVNCPGGRSF